MARPKDSKRRIKLTVSIESELCGFFDFLMNCRSINKSTLVERVLRAGINVLPDVSSSYSDYILLKCDNLPFEDDKNTDTTKTNMKTTKK